MSSFARDIAAPFQSSEKMTIDELIRLEELGRIQTRIASSDDIVQPNMSKEYIVINALEAIADLKKENYFGPHKESNWVIPGRLIAGAYPADKDIEKTEENLLVILQTGVTHFVCLQSEYNPDATEESVQSEKNIRPYMNDLTRMFSGNAVVPAVAEAMKTLPITIDDIEFIHVPIKDCNIINDTEVRNLVQTLYEKIVQNKKIYVHCWGGHGRTGTVNCILLSKLYGISAHESMLYNNVVHMFRKSPVPIGSPQTRLQIEQVSRIVAVNKNI
jgi:predicted protein tyrosine phosphatase